MNRWLVGSGNSAEDIVRKLRRADELAAEGKIGEEIAAEPAPPSPPQTRFVVVTALGTRAATCCRAHSMTSPKPAMAALWHTPTQSTSVFSYATTAICVPSI